MAVIESANNYIYKEVFGTIGLVLWSIQLFPQVYDNYRYKLPDGICNSTLLLWISANLLQGVYTLQSQLAIPLIIQPHSFGALSIICFVQNRHYSRDNRKTIRTLALLASIVIVLVGIEIGSVLLINLAINSTQVTISFVIGIVSPILLSLGFIRQIVETIREKSAGGLSKLAIIIDTFGGLFCILSLLFHDYFDWVASLTYSSVVILDIILLGLCFYYKSPKKQSIQQIRAETQDLA